MILACGPNARHTLIQARIRVSSTGTTKSQILAWPGSNCEQKKEEPPDVFGQDLPDGWKEGSPVTFSIGDQQIWEESGLQVPKLPCNCEILAHFDDDDLYASTYLTWMKHRLEKALEKVEKEKAEKAEKQGKLPVKEFRLVDVDSMYQTAEGFTWQDMTFGFMDVERDPLARSHSEVQCSADCRHAICHAFHVRSCRSKIPRDQRHGWLYGWGSGLRGSGQQLERLTPFIRDRRC
ncbi:unnamed protein product [Symbiodinium natans]|uniref:Uncharacterized protein n=1 Tax=Symbiodinium natans TaxID=878477 RepID=A0A812UQL3_9DINO|nr:unnamed protein product [Symbiodinium natans]